MKRMLPLIIAVIMALSFTACKPESNVPEMTVEQVIDRKVIVAGFYEGVEPFSYKNENGSYSGFDLEVGKEIARRLGVTLNLRTVSKDEAIANLADGTVDFLASNLLLSDKELKQFEETDEILENRQFIVVAESSDIKKSSQLKGKKVGVMKGAPKEAFAKESISKKVEQVDYSNSKDACEALKDGSISAVVADEAWIYAQKAAGEKLRIIGKKIDDRDYTLVFRPNDEALCERIEDILEEMQNDGTMDKIAKNTFGAEYKVFE